MTITPERLNDLIEMLEVDELGFRKDSDTAKALRHYRELRASDAWQPIETAPKDGTRILIASAHKGVYHWAYVARLIDGSWQIMDRGGRDAIWLASHPSHWLPLPAAPSP